jgi:hypothetical protein
MNKLFNTEQDALAYKVKHQLFILVPEYIECYGKFALVFPLKCHVSDSANFN